MLIQSLAQKTKLAMMTVFATIGGCVLICGFTVWSCIALVNKEDKPTRFDAELIAPYFAMVLPVCCQEEGARKVTAAAVARLLGTSQIDPHAASLSGQRQLSAATRARDAVAGALDAAQGLGLDAVSVCVDDALDALCELTGENASEAVINEVFERFCVGK